MSRPVTAFAPTLRGFRRTMRLTQDALAERAHLSPSYVKKLERGVRVPGIATSRDLARALSLQPRQESELLGAAAASRARMEGECVADAEAARLRVTVHSMVDQYRVVGLEPREDGRVVVTLAEDGGSR